MSSDEVSASKEIDEGVAVEVTFTGAHLLHLSAAGCVLNDVYREATQAGDFESETWWSTGIT